MNADTPRRRLATIAAFMFFVLLAGIPIGWLLSEHNTLSESATHLVIAIGGLGYAALLALASFVAVRRVGV